MKDKDFGYVILLLVVICFGKDIKDFAAKKLGNEEPASLTPEGAFWQTRTSDDWLKPSLGGSQGLIGRDRLPESTHHAPRDAFRHAERDDYTLGIGQKPSSFGPFKAQSTTWRLDSTSASGEALADAFTEGEQPAHAK